MSDEPAAIAGTRGPAKERVDGTLCVTVYIEPYNKSAFHRLFPEIDMPCALAPLNPDVSHASDNGTEVVTAGHYPGDIDNWKQGGASDIVKDRIDENGSDPEYREEARKLRTSGFFRCPDVCVEIGSDFDFQQFCREKIDCVVCKNKDYDPDTGISRTEFAHVRRAGEAGTGIKPEYSGVSLCHDCHSNLQHQHGETAAYRKFMMLKTGQEQQVTIDQANDWFDKKRIYCLEVWGWETLKAELGYESWVNIPPKTLYGWSLDRGIEAMLPECYRNVTGVSHWVDS